MFQPTLPLRGATGARDGVADSLHQVSTHAPLAGSDGRRAEVEARPLVSTHAPLAGSDSRGLRAALLCIEVSTHAPLAGSDRYILLM